MTMPATFALTKEQIDNIATHFTPFTSFETDPEKLVCLTNNAGEKVFLSRMALIHASKSKDGFIVISLYGPDVEDEDFQLGKATPDNNELHIPLPHVHKLTMELIARFAELHFQSPMHTIPAPLETATIEALSLCTNPAPWVAALATELRTPHDPAQNTVTPEYVSFYQSLTQTCEFLFIIRMHELLSAILGSICKPDPNRPMGKEGHILEMKRLQKVFCIPDELMNYEEIPTEELRQKYPTAYSTEPTNIWKEND